MIGGILRWRLGSAEETETCVESLTTKFLGDSPLVVAAVGVGSLEEHAHVEAKERWSL